MRHRAEFVLARRLLRSFAVGGCLASVAMAGPNAGGVLVVHDISLPYSSDTTLPPLTPPPGSCAAVDDQIPTGVPAPDLGYIWKVYAVFPPGSSPRLRSVTWGEGLSSDGGGYVAVLAAGLPDPVHDVEITGGGWPYADGGSIGESFPSGVKLTTITELYWFAGYGHPGLAGEPQYFCTQPHGNQASVFGDDSVPPHTDPIMGYGCLGFGASGLIPCGGEPGVCCITTTCILTNEDTCAFSGGTFLSGETNCVPSPCLPSGVGDAGEATITTLRATPNPFTGSTTLHLSGPPATSARVLIFDAVGRLVRTAWAGSLDEREVAIIWDGRDRSGREAPAGVYLLRVETSALGGGPSYNGGSDPLGGTSPSGDTAPYVASSPSGGTPCRATERLVKSR